MYTYYELDPIGFIENLCVNQDKPELQCNGKCYLKSVAQSQNKTQNNPESAIDFEKLLLYVSHAKDYDTSITRLEKEKDPIIYQNNYSFNTSDDCFHPPRI
ncbi:hypothetical protein ES692_11890 [Psychroserpens burtonensis]|uniref:Uncharacterized protein n=2 Tax=Psychroserpens burtonensis TaxID=49278 RepID=A0A5C7BER8_9FLAO|nr:hypothetical protein ES692_11890 [Psychroserpens burtonensis]